MNKYTDCSGCMNCKKGFYHEVIHCLVSALDYRDHYTQGHSSRVGEMALELAKMIHLEGDILELVHISGHLHDIGKIGVPDNVLLKTGRLSENEWIMMKKHPLIGADIINKCSSLNEVGQVILQHHERWDGKGYPNGLKGEEIHIAARIISICDTIDAMSSNRPYRRQFSWEFIREEVLRNSGTQFDPNILIHVNALIDRWVQIYDGKEHFESA